MSTNRIVVIGAAGDMAGLGVERLAAHNDGCSFELYDLDLAGLEALASRLPQGRARIGALDLFDADALRRVIRGASLVVLGAGPYLRTAPPVMRACIDESVHYLDFDDDVESTLDGLHLDADARAAGISLLIGCGASPGMSNVLVVDAASTLDEVDEIEVCWVSGDEGPRPYGRAVVEHALHMASGQLLTWRDGRQVTTEAFVANEVVPLAGVVGDYRLYEIAHPEAVTLPRRFPRVRSVRVLGGLHPQPTNGLLRGIAVAVERGQLTVPKAVEWFQAVLQDESGSLMGWRYALAGMLGQVRRKESSGTELARYLWRAVRGQHPPYVQGLLLRVAGLRDGQPATITMRTPSGGPDTFLGSSMAAVTGTCVAAFATLAVERTDELRGALTPEEWVDPSGFYAALGRLGVPPRELAFERSLAAAPDPGEAEHAAGLACSSTNSGTSPVSAPPTTGSGHARNRGGDCR